MAGPTGPTKTADRRRAGAPADRPRPGETGPPPPDDGAGRRFRLRLPGRRTVLLVVALAVVLGGFGTWALYGSSWLRVRHVSVDGTRVLTERQVLAAARIPVGAPVASVDRDAAAHRLRAALPRLSGARVVRAWPHGIGIHVTERRPELVLRKEGADGKPEQPEKYVEVDAHGVRFATVTERPKGVPLLVMETRPSASTRHFGTDGLRREAVHIAAALPASVARDTRTVRVRSYDSVTLELTGGRTVMWGSGERAGAKAKSLTALMKAAEHADHFDVSVPSAPAASSD